MKHFPYHTLETAPINARPLLDGARKKYGMIPNLYAKMAEAPTLLQAYLQIAELFSNSGLTPTEQHVVLLTASRVNNCTYCVGVHSAVGDMGGIPSEVTDAIRNDTPIQNAKLEALRQITAKLVEQRGWVPEADLQMFLDAGFKPGNILDVVLGIGQKTLSNYTNHLVATELDTAFSGRAWQESK